MTTRIFIDGEAGTAGLQIRQRLESRGEFELLRLGDHERKNEARIFEERVRDLPEVMECYAMSGGYDYLLRVVSADLEQYNRFLRDQLLEIESVDTVQTSFALVRLIYRTSLPLRQLEG